MKKIKIIFLGSIILTTFYLMSCTQLSESVINEKVGLNGGFEVTENGLPVNWLFYTENTTKSGDFDIITDTTDFKEGNQSLKFNIRSCSDKGDRFSPGIANEMEVNSGETYKVSFWFKNTGCKFYYKIRGVSAKTGIEIPMQISTEVANDWKFVETTYTIPTQMNRLRFELNVLSPGSFWIDDVKIEKTIEITDK